MENAKINRVAIIGGLGYIGSHTVRCLLEHNVPIVVFDNLSAGYDRAIPPHVDLFEGDIRNPTDIDAFFSKFDDVTSVIHFAAKIEVGESMKDPAIFYRNNVIGTINLLDGMRKAGVNHIVFSSTAAVFGEPEVVPISISASKQPINPYGRTKNMVEEILSDYSMAYGLNFAALRYFNACGAHPSGEIGESHSPESHLIPLVLQVPLGQREKIFIFGDDYDTEDGTCVRDYIHVCDLAEIHYLALQRIFEPQHNKLLLNLGYGHGYSVKEVIETAREVTGHAIPAQIADRRPGDPAVLIANGEGLREFGYVPQYDDLKQIISHAWKWHSNNPNGFREDLLE
ncbi:hypothetical protein PCE1_004170 [Barthelona sp. PCE]